MYLSESTKFHSVGARVKLPFALCYDSLCYVAGTQSNALLLENRVTVLEENGNDNSSIVELEMRVTAVEIENVDQADSIATNTENIEGAFVWYSLLL